MVDQSQSSQSTSEDLNRRSVLKMSGSTALAGFGLVSGIGTVSAGGEDDEEEYEIQELTPKEKGQLRGEVFSSAAFKTIRRTTRNRDYKPNFGEMEAAKLTNTSTGEETKMVRFPCEYVGDADDDKTRGAALFGHKNDDEILARCISQCEGESIHIDDCLTGVEDKSGAMDENEVNVLEIPVSSGGNEDA